MSGTQAGKQIISSFFVNKTIFLPVRALDFMGKLKENGMAAVK